MQEIGGPKSEDFLTGVIRVTDAVGDQTTSGILRRIGEPAQCDSELLRKFKNAGLSPGARVSVSKDPKGYRVEAATMNGAVVVSTEIAHHLYLAA
jgi:DtxR family Mn-dependent transcriptional regulator